jgi:hypothetical protein
MLASHRLVALLGATHAVGVGEATPKELRSEQRHSLSTIP